MLSSSVMSNRSLKLVLAVLFGTVALVMSLGALVSTEDSTILLVTSGAMLSLTLCLAFSLGLND